MLTLREQEVDLEAMREERNRYKRALEYVEEHYQNNDDGHKIKRVVRIALGLEPKRKIYYANLGKYFCRQRDKVSN